MKSSIAWLAPLAFTVVLLGLACTSRRQPSIGLVNGKLMPCPKSPNCVSSEEKDGPFFVEPLVFTGTTEHAWDSLVRAIQDINGKIEQKTDLYLWATFRSKVFRFVDDLECRLDDANSVIHIRSASRIGYSDLGVNRKRVEALRSRFVNEIRQQGGSI